MDVYLSNHFSFHYHVRIISWKLSFENTIELKISKANVKCLSNNRIYVRYLKSQSKKSTFRFKKEAYNYAKCKPTFFAWSCFILWTFFVCKERFTNSKYWKNSFTGRKYFLLFSCYWRIENWKKEKYYSIPIIYTFPVCKPSVCQNKKSVNWWKYCFQM